MNSMKQFIIENVPWIFSGIGVAVIAGILRFLFKRKTANQSITAGHASTNVQTGNGSTVLISNQTHIKESISSHSSKPINISDQGSTIHATRISEGDYQEIMWGSTKVRITLHQILQSEFYISRFRGKKESLGADIEVSIGGGLVYGGTDCIENGVNRYRIPQKELSEEEPCSIYAYHIRENYFNFFRLFIDHVNPHSRQVTLNLFFANTRNVKAS